MLRKTTAEFMLVILAMVTTTLLAQGRGPGIGMPMYDPKTELTLSGSIEEVQQTPCMGKRTGVHLLLKTQSEAVDVCVGPAGYIQQNGFSFAKGDIIELIGSKVNFNGRGLVVARQITKEKQTLTLRDAQGVPQWSGGLRRSY
jgi:hypothetical protein